MPVFSHEIPTDPPRQRMDAYAAVVFVPFTSRSQARRAIRAGHLESNGVKCGSAWFPRGGHTLVLTLPEAPRVPVLALDLDLLHVDPHLAIVHKPAGIHVRGNHRKTVWRALRHNLPISDAPDALPQPEPVHRLDYRTSGLLVVARTASARRSLGAKFEAREIDKRYRAMLVGRLEGSGEVNTPIDDRSALTHWAVSEHTRSLHVDWLTTVDLRPVTGRTHQLRRHMSEMGHPILGDDLYTKGRVLRGNGLFLCAVTIGFQHPVTGSPLEVTVDEPAKFKVLRAREDRRWNRTHPDLPVDS